jgi:hypothetical protein
MKKTLLVLLALLMACFTISSAKVDLKKKSKVAVLQQDDLVRLCYEGTTFTEVEVSIKDTEGREIFNEQINEKSFIRPYNFSELPRGDYEVTVKDETGEHKEKVRYYDRAYIGHVAQLKNKESEGSKFLVTVPEKGSQEATICVYDKENNLVFSETAPGNKGYAKVFHLKNLEGASIEIFNKD